MNKDLIKIIIEQCTELLGVKLIEVGEEQYTVEYQNKKYKINYCPEWFTFQEYTLDQVKSFIINDIVETLEIDEDTRVRQFQKELNSIADQITNTYNKYKDQLRDENDDVVLSINLSNIKKEVKDKTKEIYQEKTLESTVKDLIELNQKTYDLIKNTVDENDIILDEIRKKYNKIKDEKTTRN